MVFENKHTSSRLIYYEIATNLMNDSSSCFGWGNEREKVARGNFIWNLFTFHFSMYAFMFRDAEMLYVQFYIFSVWANTGKHQKMPVHSGIFQCETYQVCA